MPIARLLHFRVFCRCFTTQSLLFSALWSLSLAEHLLSRFLKLTTAFVVDLRSLLTSDGCTGSFSRTSLVGLPILLLCPTVHLSAGSDALVLVNGVLLLV